ncbi:MAG: hypothetical protein KBF75_14300 [Saprospiraceae bacterium]|nr:hypothetical protein [Saprospiraceae bacterium]
MYISEALCGFVIVAVFGALTDDYNQSKKKPNYLQPQLPSTFQAAVTIWRYVI